MVITKEIKEAIQRAYTAGLQDGFKEGATAALNPVEPRHDEAVKLGTYPPACGWCADTGLWWDAGPGESKQQICDCEAGLKIKTAK